MEKVRIQDDLFMAVNGEWYEKAVIPEDRASTGGFSDLDQEVEKTLMADFRAFAEGKKSTNIPEMKYAIELYNKVLDVDRRNRDGIKPLLPLLSKIKNIKSIIYYLKTILTVWINSIKYFFYYWIISSHLNN